VRRLTGGSGADLVLETGGAPTMSEAFASLAPFGRMVVYGCASDAPGSLTPAEQHQLFYRPAANQSVVGFNLGLYFGQRPEVAVQALSDVIALVASGAVTVQIGEQMPLREAARAHELLEARAVTGKIVLHP